MSPLMSPSNPYKRQIDAVQHIYECAKRLKICPDTSDSTPSTVPNETQLVPTSKTKDAVENSEADSDDESWVSESSEEPSDESSEDSSGAGEEDEQQDDEMEEDAQLAAEDVVNLRANRGKRPDFKLPGEEELEDIRPFLKDFLPKLKAANEELEAQKAIGTLQTSELVGDEEADGDEQYIELNLGLGVLEEKDDDVGEGALETPDNDSEGGNAEQRDQEKDILGKLMGREKPTEPVGIQEVTAG
ncbi:hypothetical protein PMIN04_000081 [Paraphaeosphaeria minitans]|uniref:Uncharacterized protein n=1 Tax=Paraphaeosphaeria minitans TaxID=565426 RepID=A0A9P6KSJ2_9PLEO|nr:hypothetical protein PMIN01_04513 [Paraphaeosphaeria minitans]